MFERIIEAKFGDLDGLKHINNNKINEWFELAQNDIFKIFNPELDINPDKWNLRLTHNESQFIKQIYYNKPVLIKSYIEKIGIDYFTCYQEVYQENTLKSIGKSRFQYYDWIKHISIKLPDNIIVELEKHLME